MDTFEAIGVGVVELQSLLLDRKMRGYKLHDVLYVPQLFNNLFSVSWVSEMGNIMTSLNKLGVKYIFDTNEKLIATASKIGGLYYLNCLTYSQQVNVDDNRCCETK